MEREKSVHEETIVSQPKDFPPSLPPEQDPVSASTGQEVSPPTGSGTLNTQGGRPAGSVIQLRDIGSRAEELPAATSRGLSMDLEGRYELSGVLGRGGMGEVFRGRDASLGRELALKVLLGDNAHRPEAVERFREEAQIGGQLQHPGVVPVYELGCLGDGRPFFTMKLVKGVTLEKLLHDRRDPAQDRPRFLKVFEQVCQAVAYAHARGVIHRDLKPPNVMVGAFGEVQVMDWGLAKVLGNNTRKEPRPPGPINASVIRTHRDGSSGSETCEGDVLGTPAYMPPEQALGEMDRLDERCDVFSLGAILCEVLTGRPLYVGEDVAVVLRKARRGEREEALSRLDGCGADPELLALTKRCLAIEPEQRPRHAGEVAKAVEAYLASVEERVRQAEVERARAEVRAATERRARRLTLGLGAAVLLLVVAGGSGAWWFQQQCAAAQAQQRAIDEKARLALERARGLLDEGWRNNDLAKLKEAKADADRAVEVANSGAGEQAREEAASFRKEVEARIGRAEKNHALLIALLDIADPHEKDTYRSDEGGSSELGGTSADEQYGEAFKRWGLDVDKTSVAEVVAQLNAQPKPVVREVVSALDSWMYKRRQKQHTEKDWRRLRQAADQLDSSDARRRLRAILAGESAQREQIVAGLTDALLPWTALCELERGRQWRALLKLRGKVDATTQPVLTVVLLSKVYQELGDTAEAERILRLALAKRPDQVALLNALGKLLGPDRGMSHDGRGNFYADRSPKLAEAIECFRAARALRPQLGITLGAALVWAGREGEAEAILRDMAGRQPNNPEVHFYLGRALDCQKKPKEAEAVYRKAIELKPDYAEAYFVLGSVLGRQKKLSEAVAAYYKALELKPNYAAPYGNLGVIFKNQKKLKEAESAYRKGVKVAPKSATAHNYLGGFLRDQKKLDEAVTASRKAIELKPDYAEAHNGLGITLYRQKKLDEAVTAYRRAVELAPRSDTYHNNLGNALYAKRDWKGAAAAFRKASELNPKYATYRSNLGDALREQSSFDEAVTAYREAIELKPDYDWAYNGLGIALKVKGDLDAAIAAYDKAIGLDPGKAVYYDNLGHALYSQGVWEGAAAAFRKASGLNPENAAYRNNLGDALRGQGKLDEAVAASRKAIALKPDYDWAYNSLGITLYRQKKLDEAVTAYRKAVELAPNYAVYRDNLGSALRDQKKPDEAIASYRKAVELAPRSDTYHNNLGNALYSKRDWEGAVVAYHRATELAPKNDGHHNRLGNALFSKRDWRAAAVAYRKAIDLNPLNAVYHSNLGNTLYEQKKLEEAVVASRKAIELKPDYAYAHNNLGYALRDLKKLDEAVAAFRKALELQPGYANAYNGLGYALLYQKKPGEAVDAFHDAIAINNNYSAAYNGLGLALRDLKKLDEAVAAFRKADHLLPTHLRPLRDNLRQTERWVQLAPKLDAFLAGKEKAPSPQESVELAQLCASHREQHRAAVRFYTDAFKDDPTIANDLPAAHRSRAAYSAALAAAGKGKDAPVAEQDRAALRRQALGWLRANLQANSALLDKAKENRPVVRRRLTSWLQATELADVREDKAVAALPEAERKEWQQFWAEVKKVLEKTRNDI